jgi:transcription initiation factor TFIID subunit 13
VASYSRRQKIKVDDFKFVLRRDPPKLGRVIEYLNLDKKIKDQKRGFDADELEVTKAEAAREAKKAAEKEGAAGGSTTTAAAATSGKEAGAAAGKEGKGSSPTEDAEGKEKERPKKKAKIAK